MGSGQKKLAVEDKFIEKIESSDRTRYGELLDFLKSDSEGNTSSRKGTGSEASHLQVLEYNSEGLLSLSPGYFIGTGVENLDKVLLKAWPKPPASKSKPHLRVLIWQVHHKDGLKNTLKYLGNYLGLDPEFCAAYLYLCSRASQPDVFEKGKITVLPSSKRSFLQLLVHREEFCIATIFPGNGAEQNLIIFGLEKSSFGKLKMLPSKTVERHPQKPKQPLDLLFPYIDDHFEYVENWHFKHMRINAPPDFAFDYKSGNKRFNKVLSLRVGLQTSFQSLEFYKRYNYSSEKKFSEDELVELNNVIWHYEKLIKVFDEYAEDIRIRVQQEQFEETITQSGYANRFTLVATFYLPLSLTSSIFGMNVRPFDEQPSVKWVIGCVFICFCVSFLIFWFESLCKRTRRGVSNLFQTQTCSKEDDAGTIEERPEV